MINITIFEDLFITLPTAAQIQSNALAVLQQQSAACVRYIVLLIATAHDILDAPSSHLARQRTGGFRRRGHRELHFHGQGQRLALRLLLSSVGALGSVLLPCAVLKLLSQRLVLLRGSPPRLLTVRKKLLLRLRLWLRSMLEELQGGCPRLACDREELRGASLLVSVSPDLAQILLRALQTL